MTTLYVREDSGYREATPADVLTSAQGLIAQRFRSGCPVLTSPVRTREYLRLRLGALDHEVFGCLFMDNRNRLICVENLFRGTIDGASVHPREVVKAALQQNAAAVILFHNHPSGVADASPDDISVTRAVVQAGKLLDIECIDHLIIGSAGKWVSLKERGLGFT